MEPVKFSRDGNTITIVLPDLRPKENEKYTVCPICGAEGTKRAPIGKGSTDSYVAILRSKITDHKYACRRCNSSLTTLAHKIIDLAREKTHPSPTVSLPVVFFGMQERVLKPDAKETIDCYHYYEKTEELKHDPYMFESYTGWPKYAQMYLDDADREYIHFQRRFEMGNGGSGSRKGRGFVGSVGGKINCPGGTLAE